MQYKKRKGIALLEQRKKEVLCFAVTVFLLVLGSVFVGQGNSADRRLTSLSRPLPGEGSIVEHLVIENEEGERREEDLELSERIFSAEELETLFAKAESYLKEVALKENADWQSIESDLELVVGMPESPVQIYWDLSGQEYIDRQGQLLKDALPEQGAELILNAVILCQGQRRDVKIPLKIVPPQWTEEELWWKKARKQLLLVDKEQAEQENISLPAYCEEKEVRYYRAGEEKENSPLWLLFSVVAGGALYAALRREEKEKKARRKKCVEREYSAFIQKLLLFLNAGMSIRNSFVQLRKEGETRKDYPLAKELSVVCKALENGASEGNCYVAFGEATGVRSYIRLGVLLAQNLRTGTHEIMEYLEREVEEAFFYQKEQAKEQGEEMGVRLLLPMGILLLLTLVVIMIPAFLQF